MTQPQPDLDKLAAETALDLVGGPFHPFMSSFGNRYFYVGLTNHSLWVVLRPNGGWTVSKDRPLTINGKPFIVEKTGNSINLVEA